MKFIIRNSWIAVLGANAEGESDIHVNLSFKFIFKASEWRTIHMNYKSIYLSWNENKLIYFINFVPLWMWHIISFPLGDSSFSESGF